jgi:hypothetical protein
VISFSTLFLAALAPAASAPPPASVPDVVAAASLCVDALATPVPDPLVLEKAGWTEQLPRTPGGTAYQKDNVNVRIALIGPVCSLVAAVKTPDEVQAALLSLDAALNPDSFAESDRGIQLTKGKRIIDFLVGAASSRTPAAVRIDTIHSESR